MSRADHDGLERPLEVRIHGELCKLGIAVTQSTVARYLPRPWKPPCQTWRTFLTNHPAETAAIDFFTVPTATFRIDACFLQLPRGADLYLCGVN